MAGIEAIMDRLTQLLLPTLTILGFLLTSLRLPQVGLVFNLASEVFWVYSSWKAWRKAGQIGILVSTIAITIILLYGVLNYWFLSRR